MQVRETQWLVFVVQPLGCSEGVWGLKMKDFVRFVVVMFFRKASPQTEGRRHAHHGIKFSPVSQEYSLDLTAVLAAIATYTNTVIYATSYYAPSLDPVDSSLKSNLLKRFIRQSFVIQGR